jgi:hypothetical protein
MSITPRVFRPILGFFLTLFLVGGVAATGRAADQKAALEHIKELNAGAAGAYTDGDFDRTFGQLLEAIKLARDSGLGSNAALAKSYVLMGVLLVNEAKNTKVAIQYFAKALEISPAIQVPPSMVTKAVKAAFDKAEDQDGPVPDPPLPEGKGQRSAKETKQETTATDVDEQALLQAKPEKPQSPAERRKAEAEEKQRAKQAEAEEKQRAKQEKAERAQQERESAKLTEQLAQAKVGESQSRAERERLQQEKADRDRQITELKGRAQQLERDYTERNKALTAANARIDKLEGEKADRDKQLADAKARMQQMERDFTERNKALAAANARIEKLEKLEAEKPERERQLSEAKARVQQLEKEKADREKALATAKDSEKKTQEANDKLEHTLNAVAARERERLSREDQERREHEKLIEGPELPGHISEAIHCTLPDEVPSETDLYVHCVPKPGLNAKMLALYYRPSGVAVFNTLVLERSRKGWYIGTIPGGKVRGKMLQYYVEARDGKDGLAAATGKPGSPNVMTIKAKR